MNAIQSSLAARSYGVSSLQGVQILDAQRAFQIWFVKATGHEDYWNQSLDAIRTAANHLVGDGSMPGEYYKNKLGSCNDWGLLWVGDGCLTFDQVDRVITCYNNAAAKSQIEPYYRANYPLGSQADDQVIRETSTCSGVDYYRTKLVLQLMHELWADTPSLVHVGVIDPAAFKAKVENRATSIQDDSVGAWMGRAADSVGGAIATAVDIVKWTLIAGVIAFGVVWAYQTAQR